MTSQYPGRLFIVAAPSGGGKTTLVKNLVETLPGIDVSISHTTRDMRPTETNGVDYFFVNDIEFQRMVHDHAFIEHAHVFHHCYGTSAAQINDRLHAGIDVVLDIDWQGAQQIKRAFTDAVSVFIIPPSLEILNQRLMDRQRDDTHVIADRMQQAREELSHYDEFDYLIVNDDFNQAASELKAIVQSHRLRMARQSMQQRKLLSFLLSGA
ncbi:MAG TPA: guanylate kinase [Legionella sp.]|nr:guanylate kinase [Legionella sp.]